MTGELQTCIGIDGSMLFVDEEKYLGLMKEVGVVPCKEGRGLCYEDEESVLGFDFTNLTVPLTSPAAFESPAPGDRRVESSMVSTLLDLLDKLGEYPASMYLADDEWLAEETGPLVKNGHMTKTEGLILSKLCEEDHGMDVIVVGPDEKAIAESIIIPQLTLFSTTCCITGPKGRVLAVISEDDEVSFNTNDPALFQLADAIMKELEPDLPFKLIRA